MWCKSFRRPCKQSILKLYLFVMSCKSIFQSPSLSILIRSRQFPFCPAGIREHNLLEERTKPNYWSNWWIVRLIDQFVFVNSIRCFLSMSDSITKSWKICLRYKKVENVVLKSYLLRYQFYFFNFSWFFDSEQKILWVHRQKRRLLWFFFRWKSFVQSTFVSQNLIPTYFDTTEIYESDVNEFIVNNLFVLLYIAVERQSGKIAFDLIADACYWIPHGRKNKIKLFPLIWIDVYWRLTDIEQGIVNNALQQFGDSDVCDVLRN